MVLDVYNMQLSNRPAEALATRLVETSNGAFEMVGYASGGQDSPLTIPTHTDTDRLFYFAGTEAMEGVIKIARQVSAPI